MVKISQLPGIVAANLSSSDKVPIVDTENSVTDNVTLSQLITYFFNNIPSGTIPNVFFDHVISGGVWSGDSYGSNRNASMTAINVYINNRTIAISAVTARTFTASKDTYIDVLDNLDGTGTLVYTEVNNNAASPTLASNSIRIGIIVTGAGSIADAGSVNQGQQGKVLPIASSIPYEVTDSLGNLICPRDPARKTLGYRQNTSGFGAFATTTSDFDITGLSMPIIVPANRKVRLEAHVPGYSQSGGIGTVYVAMKIKESSTQYTSSAIAPVGANIPSLGSPSVEISPSSGLHTYKLSAANNTTGPNGTFGASSTGPMYIKAELV